VVGGAARLLTGQGAVSASESPKSGDGPNNPSLHSGPDLYIQPDTKGNVQAPLINYKAAANYLAGYQSNEYYEELEAITLPRHMAKGTQPTKGFYLTGDSMEPTFYADDIAVCQQVPRGEWRLLKEETVAVVVSNSRGLQLKRVTMWPSLGTLRCQSDNPHSPTFDLSIDDDVLEIWRFGWLLTKRCEKANQDLQEWRRQMENEVGDLRYLLEQVVDAKVVAQFRVKHSNEK
jgi:phage repressor protein C with HTH and peptisase S24 domain